MPVEVVNPRSLKKGYMGLFPIYFKQTTSKFIGELVQIESRDTWPISSYSGADFSYWVPPGNVPENYTGVGLVLDAGKKRFIDVAQTYLVYFANDILYACPEADVILFAEHLNK